MEILDINLADITDPTFQPRDKLEAEGIEALAASIKEIGLINPIVVRKADTGYELVTGTRRCHAAMSLGWTTIPAKVIEQGTRDAALFQYSENFHRQDLNPIQHAKMLEFMIKELGYSTAELAQFTNKSKEWISRTLSLLDMDLSAQQALEAGKLAPSTALELKTISDPQLRTEYTQFAIDKGLSEKAAREWAHQAKAVIAAKQSRALAQAQPGASTEQPQYLPLPPRTCTICGVPEDKAVLEDWPICWHCGKTLRPPTSPIPDPPTS